MISSKNKPGRIPWKLLGIEAVLVVLSVLLALGLNKWNENRSNRELSQRALQAMLDEAANNCTIIQELQPYHRAVFSGETPYEGLGQVFLRNDAWTSAQTAGAIHHMDYRVAAAAGTVHALQSDHRRLVENGILAVYITATNQDVDLEIFKQIMTGNNKDWLRGPHPFMLADLIRIQEGLIEAYDILFERSSTAYGDAVNVAEQCSS